MYKVMSCFVLNLCLVKLWQFLIKVGDFFFINWIYWDCNIFVKKIATFFGYCYINRLVCLNTIRWFLEPMKWVVITYPPPSIFSIWTAKLSTQKWVNMELWELFGISRTWVVSSAAWGKTSACAISISHVWVNNMQWTNM